MMAEVYPCKESGRCRVCRTLIAIPELSSPAKAKARFARFSRIPDGLLGIDTDADQHGPHPLLIWLRQIPIYCGCFSISHGSCHCRQCTVGNGTKRFLQPFRYVNRIQIIFPFLTFSLLLLPTCLFLFYHFPCYKNIEISFFQENVQQ